ncbi:uncharacterized protein C10orf67 homolog, mitochondrial isoform X2 [Ictalurus furcatus]|uniref:uncharacterized protein C10orf67 homolog, mitochondrial isoform X2 n=1 Tax=Ictalurus furcatus TaxID=66913 RepID=UPI00235026C0|nr:uncharacterized protein C10orf67 homolog, mitochondrial isoform X2 [Ictalurus furcatus]
MDLVSEINCISLDEDEEEDMISEEIAEIQGYSLGNQLRLGFFGQDASVQTDVSELPLVTRLSTETTQLTKEMDALRKEIGVKLKFLQAQYESRLKREADDFRTRINYKVKAIEEQHKEVGCAHRCCLDKVKVLRNSCRQQLSYAIDVIKASYKKTEMMEVEPRDTRRVQELLDEIQEKDFKIESLSDQLREYKEQLEVQAADDPEESWLKTENSRLEGDVDALHVKIEQIQQALMAKDQKLKDLASDISELKSTAEADKKALRKMTIENEQLKVQLNVDKESGRKKMTKQEMDKEIESIEHSRQNERLNAERKCKEEEGVKEAEQEKPGEMLFAQDVRLKAQAGTVPKKVRMLQVKNLVKELEKLRNAEASHKELVDRLRKQMAESNRKWEKKFEVLRKSFYAIKDEMFLRHSLQRKASLRYQMEVPVLCQACCGEKSCLNAACCSTNTQPSSTGPGALQRTGCRTTDETTGQGTSAGFRLETDDEDDEDLVPIVTLPPPPNSPTPERQSSHNV